TITRYSLSELLEGAQNVSEEDGFLKNIEKLEALVDLHWSQAEPLLREYVNTGPPRVAAFSLARLYLYDSVTGNAAQADSNREKLKSIVENNRALGRARDVAAEALLITEWKGRDEWYLSLFAEPSLRDLRDGHHVMNPLTVPVAHDPDRWIPVVAGLVNSRNRAVHDMAVTCLVSFYGEEARADALAPLLPWLHDPKWSSARDRLRLIQSVADLNLRESIPGLIAVVDREDDSNRAYAAEALGYFKDPRALPALKRALEKETSEGHHRRLILQAVYSNGGITAEEAAAALQTLAIEPSTPEGRERRDEYGFSLSSEPVDTAISLALFLKNGPAPSSETFALSIDRILKLENDRPSAARAFEDILDQWSDPLIDRDFVNRLERGKATATATSFAIRKRSSLARTSFSELRRLAAGKGFAAGVASALLMDPRAQESILNGSDGEKQAAFLASSRIARDPLPIASVARLLDSDSPLLREAAERYLEVEDSPCARQLVLSRHIGEARILGERSAYDPGHSSFDSFDALEQQLRQTILATNGPDEILALLSAGYWGDAGQFYVFVRGRNAELIINRNDDRRSTRKLTEKEFAGLREFIEMNRIDDLGPFEGGAVDGIQLEFVGLTRNGGRRVFMNNPQLAPGSIYWQLRNTFARLENSPGPEK
ncbi:MAG TPA: HEAT repeat domain-containing protein, partial [Terriglobia bacterium]|nr:HEAT repeat domain-containing protein [Terriglobia bacterium]